MLYAEERHALVADLRGSFTGYGDTLPQTVDGGISPAPSSSVESRA